MKKTANYNDHILVPKHVKLSETEKKKLLENLKVSLTELPIITADDPAISSLKVERNDIIKIIRKSLTSGESVFYRRVI